MRVEAHAAEALGPALAARVARDLAAAIAARGRAALAVPGGTTPAPFLTALGAMDLAWAQVTVTLTDERWVPAHDARSNQRLLGETLFAGQAAAASFVPLYTGAVEPAAAETVLSLSLQPMLPLDVVVLGMGADRHTASLFPGSPQLEAALAPGQGRHALAVTAPGQPEPRITLSAPVLSGARHVYLLIRGAGKRAALDAALAESDPRRAPIRAVLEAAHDTTVFYAD